MAHSNPVTPFIPPLPEIGGGIHTTPVIPPVVPPFSPPGSQPPSLQQGTPNQHPNGYLSPYGTPFFPTAPMAAPGSYYLPTVNLPDGGAPPPPGPPGGPRGVPPPPPPGFSSDWTGFSQQSQGTPWSQHAPMPGQPGPVPWGMAPPPVHPAFTGYNNFNQPLPGGYPPPPPHPGGGYGGPYGGPPGGGYGVHGYGGQWGYTPAPYAQPLPGGWPPQPPQAPSMPRVARADRGDKIGHFEAGPHYGPVLTSMLLKISRAELVINPLIRPHPIDDSEGPRLIWNMLFSTASCRRSIDPQDRSWSAGRQEPATFPRVSSLRMISRTVPWVIEIKASNPTIGVTCGDVIEQLSDYLHGRISKSDYSKASREAQDALKTAYHHNRSRDEGVPGGRLGEGLKRLDWLGSNSMWGGLERNDALVKETCGEALPCVVELKCDPRPLFTEDDVRIQRESRRRSRSVKSSRRSSPDR